MFRGQIGQVIKTDATSESVHRCCATWPNWAMHRNRHHQCRNAARPVHQQIAPEAVEDKCACVIAFLSAPTACTIHQICCTSHSERCFSSTRMSSCRNVQPSMISRFSHLKTRITALDVLLVSLGVRNEVSSRLPEMSPDSASAESAL